MPSIDFEPTGTGAGWSFALEGDPSAEVFAHTLKDGVGWAVRVVDDQKVRLSTGGKLNDLPGRVSFSVGDATPQGMVRYKEDRPPQWGILMHHGADTASADHFSSWPEAYAANVYVSESTFATIKALVAAGTVPRVTIWVGRDDTFSEESNDSDARAIKTGWEPDGSGLEWDNNAHRLLAIKWCSFQVRVGPPSLMDGETSSGLDLAPPTRKDLAGILDAVSKATINTTDLGRRLISLLWFCVALLALIAWRVWHSR